MVDEQKKSLLSLLLTAPHESGASDNDGFVAVNRRHSKSTRSLFPKPQWLDFLRQTLPPVTTHLDGHVLPHHPQAHRAVPGSTQAPSSSSHRMPSPRTNPRIAVVSSSSIVRGDSVATSFSYPGCEIPLITEHISVLFTERY